MCNRIIKVVLLLLYLFSTQLKEWITTLSNIWPLLMACVKDFTVHVLPNDPNRSHNDDFKNISPHWTHLICQLTINEHMVSIPNLKRARGTKDRGKQCFVCSKLISIAPMMYTISPKVKQCFPFTIVLSFYIFSILVCYQIRY